MPARDCSRHSRVALSHSDIARLFEPHLVGLGGNDILVGYSYTARDEYTEPDIEHEERCLYDLRLHTGAAHHSVFYRSGYESSLEK